MNLNLKTLKKLIKEQIDKQKLIEIDYEDEMPDDYASEQVYVELEGILSSLKGNGVSDVDIIKYVTDYLSAGS